MKSTWSAILAGVYVLAWLHCSGCALPLYATNPCLFAACEWQEEQSQLGKKVGMVWYYPNAGSGYHCIGYELVDGKKKYYDPQRHLYIDLGKWDRRKGLKHYPYNYAEGDK